LSTTVSLNGSSYAIPATGEDGWGTEVTNYLVALATGVLSKAGGSFTLTAEVDFGATYGLKTKYYKTQGATLASAGEFRLANTETIAWRNNADSADLGLSVNASDQLTYNSIVLYGALVGAADEVLQTNAGATAQEWGKIANANVDNAAAIAYSKLNLSGSILNADVNASAAIAYSKLDLAGNILNADINASAAIAYAKLNLTGGILNADINASAAIAVSKLAALTASRAMVTDGSGFAAAATTTATEIGYVNGVTSAIQTQLDTKAADADLTSHTGATAAHGATGAVVGTTNAQTLTNKTLTSAVLNTGVSGTAVLDEDTMSSDSDTQVATQQSIKAYVDTEIAAISATGTNYSAKSADYTITDVDNVRTIGMTTSTSDYTVTLPTAADNTHRIISVKKLDSGTGKCTVDGKGAETINGVATEVLWGQYDGITLQCDGSAWHTISDTRVPNSEVRVDSGNGHGSTGTMIRRFSNTTFSNGGAITYADSSTNGGSFTINEHGIYAISYTDRYESGSAFFGISVNASSLTTNVASIAVGERLHRVQSNTEFACCAATVRLSEGDVVRAHTNGSTDNATSSVQFIITQVART